MKKIILISIVCVFGFMGIQAQDAPARNFTPSQGDFSIGFDVTPIFSFVGNIFNGTENNTFSPLAGRPVLSTTGAPFPTATIMGRYMLRDNVALIANIGLMGSSIRTRAYVQDDYAFMFDPLNRDRLIDVQRERQNGFSLMLGAERRVGQNRIQGIFGGGLVFASARSTTTFEWANQMTEVNRTPSAGFTGQFDTYGGRTLESRTLMPTTSWGVATHAGVEYFIAPGISIGATVNLFLVHQRGGQTYRISERFIEATERVEEWTDLSAPGNRGTSWGTGNMGGSLFISFYF